MYGLKVNVLYTDIWTIELVLDGDYVLQDALAKA